MDYSVFLVDDDHFIRKGIRSLIDWEKCGFEVCAEADNGEDALEYIQTEKPDLVLTDIRMPVLDGLELIKRSVESDLVSNFIIISGYSDFSYAQKAVRYGVHDFILKPIDKDELEATLKKVASKIKKDRELSESSQSIVRNSILMDLLAGKNENPNIEQLGFAQGRPLCYMILEITNPVPVAKIRDCIEKLDIRPHYIQEHSRNRIGILISLDSSNFSNSNAFAKYLQSQLAETLETHVSIFIGKTVEDPSNIKESYDTAMLTYQHKFIEDNSNPVEFEQTSNQQVNYIDLEQSFYDSLMEVIEENNETAILEMIDAMIENFQTKAFALSAVQTSINRVIYDVVSRIKALDGDEQELEKLKPMLQWDEQSLSLDQLKRRFTDFTLESAQFISRLNKDNTKGNMWRIKKYIDTHYRENLTLKGIAKEFYMNPVYMGQLFKNTFGMYFKEYFLQVRMNEAKRLLRQTDRKVYEIAEDVGFNNADYFVTQFEKLIGVSPSKYRNKVNEK